jgi:hypothetical protein
MPTAIELRLKATWQVRLDSRQLHGLARTMFVPEAMVEAYRCCRVRETGSA